MAGSGAGAEKLKVFISYSRDDLKFADQLDAALDLTGFAATIDRHGISGAEDWRVRLGDLIRDADTIVFVLSPSSARSEICAWEVGEAARLKKRIIPVLCRPLEGAAPPPHLTTLNYIFFYDEPKAPGSGFGAGLACLVPALNTDQEWIREHTRLLARASEWEASGRAANRLLFGSVIADAKAWAARRPKDAPEPTALHLDYIRASEEAEAARSDEARKQVQERAKVIGEREQAYQRAATAQRIRNYILAAMTIVAALAGWQWWRAEQQKELALAQEAIAKKRVIGAQYLSSLFMLSAARASVEGLENGVFRPLPEIDELFFGNSETNVTVPELAMQIRRDLWNDPKSLEVTLDSVDHEFLDFSYMSDGSLDCLFQIYLGDDHLRRGDFNSARKSYEKANSLIADVKVKGRNAKSLTISKAHIHGRIGYVLTKVKDNDGARASYESGKRLVDKINFAPEHQWFDDRLQELVQEQNLPTLVVPEQNSSPPQTTDPATPTAP